MSVSQVVANVSSSSTPAPAPPSARSASRPVNDPAMNFRSDNVTGVASEILEALAEANRETAAMPYGDDPWTARVEARFDELFERKVAVFPVATGTAANVLGLTMVTPPYGAIYCHAESHIAASATPGSSPMSSARRRRATSTMSSRRRSR
jgi:threonine aldolase